MGSRAVDGAVEAGARSVDSAFGGGMTILLGAGSVVRPQPLSVSALMAAATARVTRPLRPPYPVTVGTPKIISFYVFTPLADPEAIRLWQHSVADSAGLRGRVIISPHGINATVGGDIVDVKRYVRAVKQYPAFKNVEINWADGTGDDFPRLSVRVRPEVVTFGVPEEITVDESGVVGTGDRLTPQQVNDLVAARGSEVVFLDGRNRIESKIGRFTGALTPDVNTTRDFVPLLESGSLDHLKGRPIVTYCTGGVRCEVLSALMRNRGFDEVYQIDGGIIRYGEEFGDRGLWEGSLYVFDRRMSMEFTADAKVIGRCSRCDTPTSRVVNHPDPDGRDLTVLCEECEHVPV